MKLLLKGARVIDPSRNLDAPMDVLVEDGKIAGCKPGIKAPSGATVLDLAGMIVVPGLIDMHTHLREPGYEYRETVASGAAAAVAGGFTSIACMPNTRPVNDNRSVTEFILRKAAEANLANIYPIGAISMNSDGKQMTEFWDLREAGIVALSDDGNPVMDAALMRRAMEYADSLNLPVIQHCEDKNLSAGGLMNEGYPSTLLGLPGIPAIAEEIMVARDILIAEYTGTRIHFAHVSTVGSVRLIRDAKKRGLQVTAETAPHYFTLTDESLRDYDTNYKVSPPLRGKTDVSAVKEGLADGTLDAIACDHAPHGRTDKEVEFEYAANGISGLETSLGLSLSLVHEGVLSWPELIAKMSCNPARILNLPKGTLAKGADADITVIHPELAWSVDAAAFHSLGKNSPFSGRKLKGRAVLTIVGGDIKYDGLASKP
ncbi:MAG: dihydroorotase [Smithella sp.]|jgi:dihydroorotase|nr:dihydroorotase [Smithella sp.]HOU56643.1 dihydroorotase [Smithellaceae bacterium]HPV72864.1 dihydroorotase [Smithellaceae bacterium]HQG99887.1 dihydroorotase [Smithellaceae bacterium]HQK91335.1 dihydroorotase [Smithellaceae bacterium]